MKQICRVILLAGWFVSLARLEAEQVVISEIMYHPRDGQAEYVEVFNNTATPFDMAEWRLTGGADYTFPAFSAVNSNLTFLKPFERLVLSDADPATTRSVYGIPPSVHIFGPWSGNLANDGERISLKDRNGVTICTVQYHDRGKWPVAADGAGHSLVLRNPNREVDDWRNWTASGRPGGTPGTEPVAAAETPVLNPEVNLGEGIKVVDYGGRWRYHDQNMDLQTAWKEKDYDDRGWPEGPGLLGFEDAALPAPGLQTGFTNFHQLTFYVRKQFVYDGSLQNLVITVDQILDDGAVYYLNGDYLGRSGVGDGLSGFYVNANRTVGNATEELNVFPVDASLLDPGTNVLAVELHQNGTNSSDIVFGMRMKVASTTQSRSGVVLNEVLPGAAGEGFVEFYNSTAAAVNLGGYYLTDTAGNLRKYRIPAGFLVPTGGFASLGFAESSLSTTNPITVYLVAPDGVTIDGGLSADIPPDGRSLGRKPAGSSSWFLFTQPTRDLPNGSQDSLSGTLRLNEVHFGPSNSVDWVELVNTSEVSVSVNGLYLSSQPDFSDRIRLTGSLTSGGQASWGVNFALDGNDEVALYLTDSANTVLAARRFQHVPGCESSQAFPDGATEWYVTTNSTRNLPNNPVRLTDVVINEVMFDPPSDQLDGEFIELYNRGSGAMDVSGWRFSDGPGFTLPLGTSIPSGGYLVVAANAARLRSVYGDLPVVGDYQGRLSNRGELIRLEDARGNLVDEVDYRYGGDWPTLTQGNGSSMELVNPELDNDRPSAWRDSAETTKAPFRSYTYTDTYRQLPRTVGTPSDYKELHFHLAGDGHVILQNIALRKDGVGTNLIVNGTLLSTNNRSASGWLCQGTHWASYVASGQLHLISDGHGDNKANRVEIDLPGIVVNDRVTLSFDARWVSGTPRLIAETWDHSVGNAFRLEIPENLGTAGRVNSCFAAAPPPQVDGLLHHPAVPRSTEDVKVTAQVVSSSPLATVELVHRVDNANNDGAWSSKPMYDDGLSGGDAVAGDGIYTATLTEHRVNNRIVQFYVRATAQNGQSDQVPRLGAARPALYLVDDRAILRDLRTERFIIGAYDYGAIGGNGDTGKYGYRFPVLSNHYFNMTFIHNEEDVFYGGEIRNSGSPWTRGPGLSRAKWKLPNDRRFRGHEKFYYDNDAEGTPRHHNRITRYWLYLLGHPVGENEYVRVIINNNAATLKEDTEPLGNDLLDRLFENGSSGELYRIDDEWWFADDWNNRGQRDADWNYKGTDNPVRYHSEWMKRTLEDDYDYSALINLFRTVSTNYTQSQIERLVDAEATLKMAAVRGYISDWDSFTLSRGKNGYLYRRWDDGKFMFMHWDSDLAFGDAGAALYNSGRPGIGPYIQKLYNLRRFYNYIAELVDNYATNSARLFAWLAAEEDANNSFTVQTATYRNWCSSRRASCLSQMGANYSLAMAITSNSGQPITTADPTITLDGVAPYAVFDVVIEGHPEATCIWSSLKAWRVSGIVLHSGVNTLNVQGVDQWGRVVRTVASFTVTKTGNSPPVMRMTAEPDSWHVGVEDGVNLDARDSYDPEGTLLSFAWVPPAGLATLNTNQPGQAAATFLRPGLFEFTVRATDGGNASTSLVREVAVYGAGGFSAFDTPRLEAHWNLANVSYRSNSVRGTWLSMTETPGQMTLQILDDTARPLTNAVPDYPWVWRALPSDGDWALQTRLHLASRQFGDYLAGLQVEMVDAGQTNRFLLGVENGTRLAALRLDSTGTATALSTAVFDADDAILRIRRRGADLLFEQKNDDAWLRLHTAPIAVTASATRGGLTLATAAPQSIRVQFDYAMLIDPSNTSELRQHLRITEIMYNPIGGDLFEYVELANLGTNTLNLAGVRFVDGITNLFGAELLAAGERIVVVKDLAVFASRYNTNGLHIAQNPFSGKLDNGGERLTLVDAAGNVILSFDYDDSGDWPGRADGTGSSLEIVDPRGDYEDAHNWDPSAEYHGSPGQAGIGVANSIVVNEVLSHTDPPVEDALELFNPTTNVVNVGGWYLSDDSGQLKKFRIPAGTTITNGGTLTLYEFQFNNSNNVSIIPFSFDSAHGDDVWLTAADAAGDLTTFVDHVDFGAAENGVSFGRYPNGSGPLVPMSQRSFGVDDPQTVSQFRAGKGAPNAYPKVGPVVLNRILYHPLDGRDEYLELLNITSTNVPLHDPNHTTNTWELADAVDYRFPTNVALAVGEKVFVVPIDPAAFRSRYAVPANIRIFGPYVGSLANEGESVELYKPDPPQPAGLPDAGFVPYVRVEKVEYNNRSPWPLLAAGQGAALLRRVPTNYGNDPANWCTDLDADGLPDDWEAAYLLSPFYPDDALLDLDGDGWTSLEEYQNGTNPIDPADGLQFRSPRYEGNSVIFEFLALAHRTYSVLHRNALDGGSWMKLQDVPAEAAPRIAEVIDPVGGGATTRFYRIVSPAWP